MFGQILLVGLHVLPCWPAGKLCQDFLLNDLFDLLDVPLAIRELVL
jgi:hypothetical protein